MKNLIFCTVTEDGTTTSYLCDNWPEVHRLTFCPDDYTVLPLAVNGKTYQERKAAARDLAISVQDADDGGLSWSEYTTLVNFFEAVGRRYGLLREFRENAIC